MEVSPPVTLLAFPENDHGNSLRLIAIHGDDLGYCHVFKKWLLWDGMRWAIDDTEQVRRLAKLTLVDFLREAIDSGQDKMREYAKSSLNAGPITNMLRMAQSELVIRPADLDTDPYVLNFRNGTVDLRTGILHPHCRQQFLTKLLHHDYRPNARCPQWQRFLRQAMNGHSTLVRYLQLALGYSMTGCIIEKAVFVLFGSGSNGKTTMLATFRKIIEEYAILLQADTLMVRQESNSTQADLADLRGARFVMTSETEDGQRLAQGKLKRITQGMGVIKAVRKYENPIEFPETHKLWVDTNRKPVITDSEDLATFNRLHPIPFTVQIPKDQIDRELPTKLLSEAEGILAWAVQGAKLWYQHGLTKPPVVEIANEEWRMESDRLSRFFDERCKSGGSAGGEELHDAYKLWAEKWGEKRILTCQEFAARIIDQPGVRKRRTKRGVVYDGIQLRTNGRIGSVRRV
jgi:putative DNA primase/helicase